LAERVKKRKKIEDVK